MTDGRQLCFPTTDVRWLHMTLIQKKFLSIYQKPSGSFDSIALIFISCCGRCLRCHQYGASPSPYFLFQNHFSPFIKHRIQSAWNSPLCLHLPKQNIFFHFSPPFLGVKTLNSAKMLWGHKLMVTASKSETCERLLMLGN